MKTLKDDPEAKMLIHCGFGHIVEDNHPSLGKAMAGILGDVSGIDPFTIDQVNLSEHADETYESPLYNLIRIDEASVFLDKENQPLSFTSSSGKIDINVAHPRTHMIFGRPDWLLRDGNWKTFKLDRNIKFPSIVAVYADDEIENEAVPVDVIQMKLMNEKSLVLPPGTFNLHIIDETGKVVRKKIMVDK